jgi:hypothetical protein
VVVFSTLCSTLLPACRDRSPATIDHDSASANVQPAATSCLNASFDGTGIGELRIGMTVDALQRSCPVVRDTIELRAEGTPARIVAVAAQGDTVEAEVEAGRVWRITITSPRFRTADSIGVGVSLDRLLALPGIQGLTGEGTLYLMSPARCGVSFRVTDPGERLRAEWTLPQLRRLPATTTVTRILIVGCAESNPMSASPQ